MTKDRSRAGRKTLSLSFPRKIGGWLGLLLWAGCIAQASRKEAAKGAPSFELHDAAERGDLDQVLRLLEGHPEAVNARDEIGSTPLHRAADTDRVDVVRVLLRAGADVDAQNSIGQTPLYWAAFDGHADIVRVLLEHRADPLRRARDGSSPYSVAHVGLDGWRNPEIVRLFGERLRSSSD